MLSWRLMISCSWALLKKKKKMNGLLIIIRTKKKTIIFLNSLRLINNNFLFFLGPVLMDEFVEWYHHKYPPQSSSAWNCPFYKKQLIQLEKHGNLFKLTKSGMLLVKDRVSLKGLLLQCLADNDLMCLLGSWKEGEGKRK